MLLCFFWLQVISLKKCGISDDPKDYFLADMIEGSKDERELDPNEIPYNITPKGSANILRLYIRYGWTSPCTCPLE